MRLQGYPVSDNSEDLVEILTVFSSRLYGSRSRKNQKAVAG